MNMEQGVDANRYELQIHQQRLRMFCEQISKTSPAYYFWVAALLGILWLAKSSITGIAIMAVAATSAELAKIRLLRSFLSISDAQNLTGQELNIWEWRIAAAMFTEGLIISAGVALLIDINQTIPFLIAFFLIGVTAFTSATHNVASLRTYYIWSAVLILPMVAKLMTSDNEYYWIFGAIAAVGSFIYIPVAAKVMHSYMVSALRLRYENLALLASAEQEKSKADKANAEKTRFLAAASHDLRQPMHAMALYIDTLGHRLKQAGDIEVIDALRESQVSMNRLMDTLLDISKLDAGVVEANPEPINLDMVIANLAREHKLKAEKNGIVLQTRLAGAVVLSDLVMLECILNNLIGNALRYTEKGGKILVASRQWHGKVRVEVWDTGTGIPQNQLQNIFTEFYQLNNPERDRNKGLGLGLSIVNRLIKLLPGHEIEVASRLWHGSRFRLILPASEERVASATGVFVSTCESLDGLRVLILEDDAAARKAAVMLVQQWGCAVKGAANAAEAVVMVESGWVPDAIISDYRLPGESTGVQAIHAIRKLLQQDVPALIVTGDTQVEILQAVAGAGFPLLHKPAAPAKLKLFLSQGARQRKTST